MVKAEAEKANMIARVGLEVVKAPEVLLEETPQPEVDLAAVVADKILEVAPLITKTKETEGENPQIKGKGDRMIGNLVCGIWQENAKIRIASLITLKFASFTTLEKDATKKTAVLRTLIKKRPALLAPVAEGEGMPA